MDEDADTTNFGVYLTDPSGVQKRIPFIDGNGNQVMQWIPADGSNLRFKIMYNVKFENGGTYELMVQGSDKSDRKSTRLNSSHVRISYAVFCLKKKQKKRNK